MSCLSSALSQTSAIIPLLCVRGSRVEVFASIWNDAAAPLVWWIVSSWYEHWRVPLVLADEISRPSFAKWLQDCLTVSHRILINEELSVHPLGASAFIWCNTRRPYRRKSSISSYLKLIHSIVQSNILITDEGKACLCDFGLSTITEFQGSSYLASTIGGNVRWAAPELFRINEDNSVPPVTSHSDIYSFGSVMLEVQLYSFSPIESPTDVVPYRFFPDMFRILTSFEMHRSSSRCTKELSLVDQKHLWSRISYGVLSTRVGLMIQLTGRISKRFRSPCKHFWEETGGTLRDRLGLGKNETTCSVYISTDKQRSKEFTHGRNLVFVNGWTSIL